MEEKERGSRILDMQQLPRVLVLFSRISVPHVFAACFAAVFARFEQYSIIANSPPRDLRYARAAGTQR